jgi:two-component system sensor histidine kinase AtoS
MREFWFKSLRGRMILLSLIIVNLPILIAGYVMKHSATESLLEEKKSKLAAIAFILDSRLGPDGFEGVLLRRGAVEQPRRSQILVLNEELAELTDEIALASPGLGAGYYHRELDAIITYGPAANFGHTVGWSIQNSHPGRQVMALNEFRVEFGTLVRGNIMNAMRPIERQGQVVGYIFVNELTDDVQAQLAAMDRGLTISIALGLLLSIMLILWLTDNMVKDVQSIIHGLRELRFNLRRPITGLKGELGEVAATINEMAAALGDARTLSENIMESMVDGVIAVDNGGIITAFNRAAERLTGFAAQEVVGKRYEEVFCSDPYFHSKLLTTLRTGEPCVGGQMEYPVRHGRLWVSISTSMLKNNGGEIIGAVVVFKDLTERKRLEEQVNRADRLATLGELMAGVAHEIRNPLTSIKGFLQYFQNAGTDKERAVYLPMLLKEADRMNRIIETLLYFSKPCQAMAAPTDLAKVLQETLLLVQSRGKSHGIVFDTRIPGRLPLVNLDGEQFKQVFLNLLVNSLQAMENEGCIQVKARYLAKTDEVEIIFADTGPGIPEDIRDKVFDPFFTTKQTGTGLGLAVVQRIVAAQGGSISIEDNEGGGALLRIIIPRNIRRGDGGC